MALEFTVDVYNIDHSGGQLDHFVRQKTTSVEM